MYGLCRISKWAVIPPCNIAMDANSVKGIQYIQMVLSILQTYLRSYTKGL